MQKVVISERVNILGEDQKTTYYINKIKIKLLWLKTSKLQTYFKIALTTHM